MVVRMRWDGCLQASGWRGDKAAPVSVRGLLGRCTRRLGMLAGCEIRVTLGGYPGRLQTATLLRGLAATLARVWPCFRPVSFYSLLGELFIPLSSHLPGLQDPRDTTAGSAVLSWW